MLDLPRSVDGSDRRAETGHPPMMLGASFEAPEELESKLGSVAERLDEAEWCVQRQTQVH